MFPLVAYRLRSSLFNPVFSVPKSGLFYIVKSTLFSGLFDRSRSSPYCSWSDHDWIFLKFGLVKTPRLNPVSSRPCAVLGARGVAPSRPRKGSAVRVRDTSGNTATGAFFVLLIPRHMFRTYRQLRCPHTDVSPGKGPTIRLAPILSCFRQTACGISRHFCFIILRHHLGVTNDWQFSILPDKSLFLQAPTPLFPVQTNQGPLYKNYIIAMTGRHEYNKILIPLSKSVISTGRWLHNAEDERRNTENNSYFCKKN